MDNTQVEPCTSEDKPILLNCDYTDRLLVKRLGAKWHEGWQMWYITSCQDKAPFKRWLFDYED